MLVARGRGIGVGGARVTRLFDGPENGNFGMIELCCVPFVSQLRLRSGFAGFKISLTRIRKMVTLIM